MQPIQHRQIICDDLLTILHLYQAKHESTHRLSLEVSYSLIYIFRQLARFLECKAYLIRVIVSFWQFHPRVLFSFTLHSAAPHSDIVYIYIRHLSYSLPFLILVYTFSHLQSIEHNTSLTTHLQEKYRPAQNWCEYGMNVSQEGSYCCVQTHLPCSWHQAGSLFLWRSHITSTWNWSFWRIVCKQCKISTLGGNESGR